MAEEKTKTANGEETVKKTKKKPWQKALIVLGCVAGAVLIFFLGVIGYFRIPVSAYYKASEKAFEIPGRADGFIAQGISYDERENTFFVTGYMNDKSVSPLYLVKKESETSKKSSYKTLYLKDEKGEEYKGHCGGLTVHGDYIYVAGGSKHCLYVYSYAGALRAEDKAYLDCEGTFTVSSEDDYMSVAFVSLWGDALVVGEFYREGNYPTLESHKRTAACGDYNQAMAVCYPFADGEDASFGLKKTPSKAISMPDLIQGAYFSDGKAVLSASYAVAFSHLYEYDLSRAETNEKITLFGVEMPLYSFDSDSLTRDIKIAPMSEEIVLVNGKTYVMCESASDKYIFGKFTGAKWCYATDLSKME